MPKEWKSRKAELKQLYIVEDKTLLEIQKILESRGFKASIRSYRMRFDEWGFRKYNLTKVPRRSNSLSQVPQVPVNGSPTQWDGGLLEEQNSRPVIQDRICALPPFFPTRNSSAYSPSQKRLSPPRHDHTERQKKDIVGDIDDECGRQLKKIRGSSKSRPQGPAASHKIDAGVISVDDTSQSSSVVESNHDEPTISIGGFKFPKQPKTPTDLFSFTNSGPEIQLYALVATWQKGNAYMDCLNTLSDKISWGLLTHNRYQSSDGNDLRALSIFQVIAKFVPSEDRFRVTKVLLAAVPVYDSSCRKLLKAFTEPNCDDTTGWIGLLSQFTAQPINDQVDLILVAAGKVVMAENLLHHHQRILLQEPDYRYVCYHACKHRDPQELRREYLNILKAFSDVQTLELDVSPKFYKFSLEVADAVQQETVTRAQESLRYELREVRQKEEKYQRVIEKYTHVRRDDVDGQLDYLLTEHNELMLRQDPPSTFATEMGDVGPTSSLTKPISTFLGPVNAPPNSSNAGTTSSGMAMRSLDFIHINELQFVWKRWKSGYSISNYYIALNKIFANFEEQNFGALIDWIAHNVPEIDQLLFTKGMVEAYLHMSAYPLAGLECKFGLHDTARIPQWSRVKQFLLGDGAQFEISRTEPRPSMKYPECALRLFGESCLMSLKSRLIDSLSKPFSQLEVERDKLRCNNYRAILEDFTIWGFGIDQSFRIIQITSPELFVWP